MNGADGERHGTQVSYHPSGLREAVMVPGLQAVLTGTLSAVVAVSAAGAVQGMVGHFSVDYIKVGALAFGVASFIGWRSYRDHWTWMIEQVLTAERETIQVMPPEPKTVRVELYRDNGMSRIDLPYPERLPLLARGLLGGGAKFSHRDWSKGDRRVFSEKEFSDLQKVFLERGLARRVNDAPNSEVALTRNGAQLLKTIADGPAALLPDNHWDA